MMEPEFFNNEGNIYKYLFLFKFKFCMIIYKIILFNKKVNIIYQLFLLIIINIYKVKSNKENSVNKKNIILIF